MEFYFLFFNIAENNNNKILEILRSLELLGLFIGSFLSSTLIPLSSDVLLIGALALGRNIWLCLFVATVGNWLGGLTTYWIGYAGNMVNIEKRFKNAKQRIEKLREPIEKYGTLLSFLAWLPIIGDLFSVALGFYRFNFLKTSCYMFLGRFFRFSVLTIIYVLYADKVIAYFSVAQ